MESNTCGGMVEVFTGVLSLLSVLGNYRYAAIVFDNVAPEGSSTHLI